MTSQWSFGELKEAALKNFQSILLPTEKDVRSAVDKRYPEIADIRATIDSRLYDLKTKYGRVLPEQLSAEESQTRRTLKRAWENDFNLMKQRDEEEIDFRSQIGLTMLASPLFGVLESYMVGRRQVHFGQPLDLATSSYKFEGLNTKLGWSSRFMTTAIRSSTYVPFILLMMPTILRQQMRQPIVLNDQLEVTKLRYLDGAAPGQVWNDGLNVFSAWCTAYLFDASVDRTAIWKPERGFTGNLRAFFPWPLQMCATRARVLAAGPVSGAMLAVFLAFFPDHSSYELPRGNKKEPIRSPFENSEL